MSYLRETQFDEKDFPTLQLIKNDYGFIPNFLRIVTESSSFDYPEPIAEPLVEKIMSWIRGNCAVDKASSSD